MSDGERASEPSIFWQRLREMFPSVEPTIVPPQRDANLADAWTPRQLVVSLMEWARGGARSPAGKEAACQWLATYGTSAPHPLSPVLGGEGRGEGPFSGDQKEVPLPPTLSPGYRGEGEETHDPLVHTLRRAWRALS